MTGIYLAQGVCYYLDAAVKFRNSGTTPFFRSADRNKLLRQNSFSSTWVLIIMMSGNKQGGWYSQMRFFSRCEAHGTTSTSPRAQKRIENAAADEQEIQRSFCSAKIASKSALSLDKRRETGRLDRQSPGIVFPRAPSAVSRTWNFGDSSLISRNARFWRFAVPVREYSVGKKVRGKKKEESGENFFFRSGPADATKDGTHMFV